MRRNRLLAIIAVLIAVSPLQGPVAEGKSPRSDPEQLRLLDMVPEAMALIRNNYVDEVDSERLVYGALRGIANSLDPDCQFLPAEKAEETDIGTSGTLGGLGIEITKREGFVTVLAAIAGTPAYRAGLMPGDRILKINEEVLRDPDLSEVVSTLRGEPGSEVTLTVVRGRDTVKTFTITRAIVKVPSVVEAKILEDSIGYVKVTRFQDTTASDLDAALEDLESQGMEALVLDLRDNPGGLLTSAVEVADLFVPGGHVIVSTKGRRQGQSREFTSRDPGTHPILPMAVLINGTSASASEIVAGAMRDLKRAVLVGERSFGRGIIQSILRLQGGGALRLTTARYYTPGGDSIQGKGIEPHVVVRETSEQTKEKITQRYREMEKALRETKEEKTETKGDERTISPEEIAELTPETPEYEEFVDVQLREAVRILKALKFMGIEKLAAALPPKSSP